MARIKLFATFYLPLFFITGFMIPTQEQATAEVVETLSSTRDVTVSLVDSNNKAPISLVGASGGLSMTDDRDYGDYSEALNLEYLDGAAEASAAEGEVVFVNAPRVKLYLSIYIDGYFTADVEIEANQDSVLVELQAVPPYSVNLDVTVVDRNGSPVDSVTNVHIWICDPVVEGRCESFGLDEAEGELGKFSAKVFPGNYHLDVSADGFLSWFGSGQIGDDETQYARTVALSSAGSNTVTLDIVDPTGATINMSALTGSVSMHLNSDNSSWHWSTWGEESFSTDDLGRIQLSGVPAGEFSVSVNLPDHFDRHTDVRVNSDGDTIRIVVVPYPTPRNRTISGVVSNSATGAVIADSQVLASVCIDFGCASFETVTDSRGRYTLSGLFPGTYSVSVDRESFINWSSRVGVALGNATQNIALIPESNNTLRLSFGESVNGGNCQPVIKNGSPAFFDERDVAIGANYYDGNSGWGEYISTDQGPITGSEITFTGVPNGDIDLWIQVSGYFSKSQKVTVSGATAVATICLNRFPTPDNFTISGSVTSRETGEPLGGGDISASTCTQEGCASVRTTVDESGDYQLNGLFPAMWSLGIWQDGYRSGWSTLRVRDTEDGTVFSRNFSLRKTQQIPQEGTGKVIFDVGTPSPEGVITPLGGIEVSLSGSEVYRSGLTNSLGRVEFTDVPPGTYWVSTDRGGESFGRPNFLEDEISALVVTGEPDEIILRSIELRPVDFVNGVQNLTGVFRDTRLNRPIAGATVSVSGQGVWAEVTTRENGSWEVPVLPHGKYFIYTSSLVNGVTYANSQTQEITVPLAAPLVLTTRSIVPGRARLEVVLRDRQTHRAVPGIEVNLYHSESPFMPSAQRTNGNGVATFTNLPPGGFWIVPDTSTYIFGETITVGTDRDGDVFQGDYVVLGEQGTSRVQMRGDKLDLSGTVRLLVQDRDGEPIEGATVHAYSDSWGEDFGQSGRDGRLTLRGFPVGRSVSLWVQHFEDWGDQAAVPYDEQIFLPSGTTEPLELVVTLSEGGSISGGFTVDQQVCGNLDDHYISAHRKDNLNGVGTAFLSRNGGNFEIRGIPENVDVVLFYTGAKGQVGSGSSAKDCSLSFGFIQAIDSPGPVVVSSIEDATVWNLDPDGILHPTIGAVTPSGGATVSGKINVFAGGQTIDLPPGRWVSIEVSKKKPNNTWESYRGLVWDYREGADEWELFGLSPGEYRFRFFESQFLGSDRRYLEQEHLVTVDESLASIQLDVTMSTEKPTGRPPTVIVGPSNSNQAGAIDVPGNIRRGTLVTLQLPEEMAGEWVSVWGNSETRDLADGWVQVGEGGVVDVVVPGNFPLGGHRIAVQDADTEIVGWSPVRVAEIPRRTQFRHVSRTHTSIRFEITNYDPQRTYRFELPEGATSETEVVGRSLRVTVNDLAEGSQHEVTLVTAFQGQEFWEIYSGQTLQRFNPEGSVSLSVARQGLPPGAVVGTGQTLQARVSGWPRGARYTYQWETKVGSTWQEVRGATKASLRLSDSDAGREFRVILTATQGFTGSTVESPAAEVRLAQRAPVLVFDSRNPQGMVRDNNNNLRGIPVTGSGALSGSYTFETNRADCEVINQPPGFDGFLVVADTPGPCLVSIAAAENSTYAASPQSRAIRVTFFGEFESLGTVSIANLTPGDTVSPGQRLSATANQWPRGARFSYQWERRGGVNDQWGPIPGATGARYQVPVGATGEIRVKLTATDTRKFLSSVVESTGFVVAPPE